MEPPDWVGYLAEVGAPAADTATHVLERLVRGRSPREIAAGPGVTVFTVRTHLKHLYAKTATSSQRELLAEVSAMRES